MARLKHQARVYTIPNTIKGWPRDTDDLTTSAGWEQFFVWLKQQKRQQRSKKLGAYNEFWFPVQKKVRHRFEFPLSEALPWGVNPHSYIFVRFIETCHLPNKKYMGFIVERTQIIPDDGEEGYIRYHPTP